MNAGLVKPKKKLGQHFLRDENIARKIVALLPDDSNLVIEIGAGQGALTKFLLEKFPTLIAVEVDKEAVEHLKKNFPTLKIINEDFLEINFTTDFTDYHRLILVGNLPYNISSPIFFKVLKNKDLVRECVFMIQKEVAERICAKSGSKTYGILSVLLQSFFDITYEFTVSENVFFPKPKVKSAVIKLVRNPDKKLNCDEKLFFRLVKTVFQQRRKMLRNGLKNFGITNDVLNRIDEKLLSKRPEQLEIKDFEYVTKIITTDCTDLHR